MYMEYVYVVDELNMHKKGFVGEDVGDKIGLNQVIVCVCTIKMRI